MSNYILDTNIISALGAEEEEEGGVISDRLYGL